MPMTPDEHELMNQLCIKIQTEQDPGKFAELVEQLNTLLNNIYLTRIKTDQSESN
jgi:hypothetical protein